MYDAAAYFNIYKFQQFMSDLKQFYELKGINQVLPDFWRFVNPFFITKEGINYETMKFLDDEIMCFDVTSDPETHKNLASSAFKAFETVKKVYERASVKFYEQQNEKVQQLGLIQAQIQGQLLQTYPQLQQDHNALFFALQQYMAPYYTQFGMNPPYVQQQAYGYGNQGGYNQGGYNQGGYNQGGYNQGGYNQGGYNQGGYNQGGYNQGGYRGQNNSRQAYNEDSQWQNQGNYQQRYESHRYVEKHEEVSEAIQTDPEPVQPVEPPKPVIEKKKLSIAEIRELIASAADKELLKKSANPTLVQQIEEINKWPKKTELIEAKEVQKDKDNYKKHNKNQNLERGKNYEPTKENEIVKGSKYNSKPSVPMAPTFVIQIGKNQNLQTKIIRDQLKGKAAELNYAEQKALEQDNLSKIEKAKRDIVYNLNRVAPENVKDIFNELTSFATEDEQICNTLVQTIIEKAWQQPKYAASYAKLSSYFTRIDGSSFKFTNEANQKKNPFKYIIIDKVQHSFDKKEKKEASGENVDLQKFAKDTKNVIFGNIKFIAELIKIKLIPKRTIKYCIFQLIQSFLDGYYNYNKKNQTELNFFEFYFEAVIEFLENLGDKYESIDEKEKDDNYSEAKVVEVKKKVQEACNLSINTEIADLENLKSDDYFEVFKTINNLVLPKIKDGRRISALLQNLEERRLNNWKKHNVEAEGPKKLKDLKEDQQGTATAEQKAKAELAKMDDKVAKLLKKWVEGDTKAALDELDSIIRKFKTQDWLGSFLKYVSDDKKDSLPKRLQLFNLILEKHLDLKSFKQTWTYSFPNVALLGSEYPFLAAVLAKIIITVTEKKGGKVTDYFIKYNQDEEEEEYFTMDEVYQKLYHYTQEAAIKDLIELKAKEKLKHVL